MNKDHDIKTLTFYLERLMEIKEFDQYPFVKMVIQNGVTEKEYQELIMLLSNINDEFKAQKEAGLLDFTRLLIQFAGELTPKLHPDDLMDALIKEKRYFDLMTHLKKVREGNNYF